MKSTEDILNAESIRSQLEKKLEVIHLSSIDSTNTEAKRLIKNGKKNEFLITADEQTAGRGRQGKCFFSPALTGVYMSLVLRPAATLQNAVTATTAAAVAVCRAVERLTDKKPEIKWVNDVYLDGKKICGILTEAVSGDNNKTVSAVIIGIGMNIKTLHFPDDVPNAGSLGAEIRRADFISAVTNELYKIVFGGYPAFMDYYRTHSMLPGKKIQFIQNGTAIPAKAIAIDDAGGLVVRLEDGTQKTLRSGEISIRGI